MYVTKYVIYLLNNFKIIEIMTAEDLAVKILAHINEQITDEDCENYIDIKSVDLTDFFHALSNIVPNYMYNKLTNKSTNNLEFNHIANTLVFQYSKTED